MDNLTGRAMGADVGPVSSDSSSIRTREVSLGTFALALAALSLALAGYFGG